MEMVKWWKSWKWKWKINGGNEKWMNEYFAGPNSLGQMEKLN